MSRRVTRSQQRKQDSEREREREAEVGSGGGSSINGDGSFSGSSVNGVESVEGTPRKGRPPTKRQKLTAVAVVVEKVPEEKAEVNGGISENEELKVQEEGVGSKVQEGKIKEKKDEQKEVEKAENKTPNGVVKGTHKKFGEEPTREVVEAVVVEVEKPVEVNGGDAAKTNKSDSEDESDDEDDAPEAVSISTSRQAILAREEDIKKAREQYGLSSSVSTLD